ncbi:MAG TPA: hypothetical protein DCO77_04060, partial [Nitrospiraceae bacterium]|nr:hypothetical protein [Nitrospiraceae bacterium]
ETRHIQHKSTGALVAQYTKYDAEGNLLEMVDATGRKFTYAYDELNRQIDTTYPDTTAPFYRTTRIHTGYDANNNITTVTEYKTAADSSTLTDVTTNTYDNFDRLDTTTQRGLVVDYGYDDNGNRTSVSTAAGTTDYTYDSRNRLKTAAAGTQVTTYTYYADGKKDTVVYPNGTDVKYTYHPTNRIETITYKVTAAGTVISRYEYEYDANGNRTQQVEEQAGATETTTYTYDNIDRMKDFTVSGAKTTVSEYTFEGYNRKTERVAEDGVVVKSRTYTYDETDWLTKVTDDTDPDNVKTISYLYDKNGNTLRKSDSSLPNGDVTFIYDSRDQLVQTTSGSPGNETVLGLYDYNAQGLRVRHRNSERGDVDYFYDDNAVLEEHNAADGSLLAHYRYADRLLSLETRNPELATRYYHFDALGSTVNLTTDTGTVQVSYNLDPWGHITNQVGTSVNRQIFTGQEHDENTGLIYFGARYYDPDTARFITQDSYLGESGTPPSLNRYLYAYGNPTVFIDLYGYSSLNAWVKTGEGYEHDRQLILGEIQKARDRDMAAGNTAMGFKYSAESTLMGLYGLGLKGVTGALKAADFLIDLGRMNESNENTETGRRTVKRIMVIDEAMKSTAAGLMRFGRKTLEDPTGTYKKVVRVLGDAAVAHGKATFVRGEAKATASTAEILGGIITGEAFVAKAGAIKQTVTSAASVVNRQIKKKIKREAVRQARRSAGAAGSSKVKDFFGGLLRGEIGNWKLELSLNQLNMGIPLNITRKVAKRLPNESGVIREFVQKQNEIYYRVFSGDRRDGSFLTQVPPKSRRFAQEALSLPPHNKAELIQEVVVPAGTRLRRSRAAPMPEWGRKRGGAEQFELLDRIPMTNFGPGRKLP